MDKYLSRHENDLSSLYQFICKTGKVPFINGPTQASWPLEENFCKTTLILHYPNWRAFSDIKDDELSWVEKFTYFVESDDCLNFIKADVKEAKKKQQPESLSQNNQPEWMEALRPNPNFDHPHTNISFDDGGPDHDWSETSHQYPNDLGKEWWVTISKPTNEDRHLKIPTVNLKCMNEDQSLAFRIIMKTLSNFSNKSDKYSPLRMVVSGSAGSGKSFLIKCLVKSIRLPFNSNKSVQVLCPIGNSANLISGVTLHSFLKIPTYKREEK